MVNSVIIAAIAAWTVSQIFKVIFGFLKSGSSEISRISWRLVWAGGMPSSHSAFTISAAVVIGLTYGFRSPLFGLALVLVAVVIYDRSRMNHIYRTFQNTFPSLKREVESNPMLNDLVGHSLPEIVVGVIIGIISGVATFIIFKK